VFFAYPVTFIDGGAGGLPGNNQNATVAISRPAPAGSQGPPEVDSLLRDGDHWRAV